MKRTIHHRRKRAAACGNAALAVASVTLWLTACGISGRQPFSNDGGNDAAGGDGGSPTTTTTTTSTGGTGGAPTAAGGHASGGHSAGGSPTGMGGNGQQPPQLPVYRIPLRIHVGESNLSNENLTAILEEVNWIWWSQAAVCFEVEVVDHDQTMTDGFDMWFRASSNTTYNGYYKNDHDIWTLDQPSLGYAPNPVDDPASRTSAHELGHGLTLSHYNNQPDSPDSLMSSGKLGFKLHGFEVDDARIRAAVKALDDTAPLYCAPITVP